MNSLRDISIELARSMFILSDQKKRKESWSFLFSIDDWLRLEEQWETMPITEKEILIEEAKNHFISLKNNFPCTYDIIINRMLISSNKSIDHLSHGSMI